MVMKKYLTIPELANLLGISRQAVYKQIKSGRIKAEKIGRSYLITDSTINTIFGTNLSQNQKRKLDSIVKKVVRQYGTLLKKLGTE